MDDHCFDRALAHKRNLNCIFSFNKRKKIHKLSHTFFLAWNRGQACGGFSCCLVDLFFFLINGAAVRFSNFSVSFQIR